MGRIFKSNERSNKKIVKFVQSQKKYSTKPNPHIIIENGPHFRCVADIWELDKKVSDQIGMKYILK